MVRPSFVSVCHNLYRVQAGMHIWENDRGIAPHGGSQGRERRGDRDARAVEYSLFTAWKLLHVLAQQVDKMIKAKITSWNATVEDRLATEMA